jgi:hypothetical protein
VASSYNLIFVFFFSKTQSSKPIVVVVVASQKGSYKNQDSKIDKTQPIPTHTLLKPSMFHHFIKEIYIYIYIYIYFLLHM